MMKQYAESMKKILMNTQRTNMKNTLLVIAALLVGACATSPTLKSVVGAYEIKGEDAGRTLRYIFLENGVVEGYIKGERWKESKWSINNEVEIYIEEKEWIEIFRINIDGSITIIVGIAAGKRMDLRKGERYTFKKIK